MTTPTHNAIDHTTLKVAAPIGGTGLLGRTEVVTNYTTLRAWALRNGLHVNPTYKRHLSSKTMGYRTHNGETVAMTTPDLAIVHAAARDVAKAAALYEDNLRGQGIALPMVDPYEWMMMVTQTTSAGANDRDGANLLSKSWRKFMVATTLDTCGRERPRWTLPTDMAAKLVSGEELLTGNPVIPFPWFMAWAGRRMPHTALDMLAAFPKPTPLDVAKMVDVFNSTYPTHRTGNTPALLKGRKTRNGGVDPTPTI